MKLYINYGQRVTVLPAGVFPDHMPPDAAYLYVLIALCGDPSLLSDKETAVLHLAKECRLPSDTVRGAIAYWEGCGILSSDGEKDGTGEGAEASAALPDVTPQTVVPTEAPAMAVPGAVKRPRAALPAYTQAQLADVIDASPDLPHTLSACEEQAGKLFSEHEREQVVALYDAYGLDSAYLITLFAYCKNTLHKTAVSYVVRTALGLYDDGIRTVTELDAMIREKERLQDVTYKLRRLFGIGDRALTKNEKQYIENWVNVWQMPMEVIEAAYEITIKNIEKPSMVYVNKILDRWQAGGIRTLASVQAAQEAYAQKRLSEGASVPSGASSGVPSGVTSGKKGASGGEHSFDLDEFLALAMKRSFD